MEYGNEYSEDGYSRRVPIVAAIQEELPIHLMGAIKILPVAQQKIILAIIDGASLSEACEENSIPINETMTFLPKLKEFLLPYLR